MKKEDETAYARKCFVSDDWTCVLVLVSIYVLCFGESRVTMAGFTTSSRARASSHESMDVVQLALCHDTAFVLTPQNCQQSIDYIHTFERVSGKSRKVHAEYNLENAMATR